MLLQRCPLERRHFDPGLPKHAPTEAYWQSPPHSISNHQSPKLPAEASVVIIGSGITGSSVAHHLLQRSPNLDVVMLEARTICSGATGRNGGHCKDVSFKSYGTLRDQIGRESAMRLVRFRRSHVDATRSLARQLSKDGYGDGHFRDVESLTAVFDHDVLQDFKVNLKALLEDFPEERGRYSVIEGEEAQKKHGLLGALGVIASPAAALWPYRLITSLLRRLLDKHQNFRLEALTPVLSITASKDSSQPYLVHTSRGIIRTQHVVHCTNGYASHLLPLFRGRILPLRGQMTALTPPDAFPRLGHAKSWSLCWKGGAFDYMTQAGDAEGHVFLGGGLEAAAKAGVVDLGSVDDTNLNQPALKHLCSVLPKHFKAGQGTTLEKAWTGIMGFTSDDFPIVGKIPPALSHIEVVEGASGHEWIAAGFNGYGMVHCWQSGRAIADMLSGQPLRAINDHFPTELFECSQKRVQGLNMENLRSALFDSAPAPPQSRL